MSMLKITQLSISKIKQWGKNNVLLLGIISFLFLVTVFAVFWFFYSAPPSTLIMTAGPKGSMFERYSEQYQKIFKRNGVKLLILPSEGSVENFKRLKDKSYKTDIGFVQGGIANNAVPEGLVSLGSVSYEPLFLFYRSQTSLELLSELAGRKVAVGEIGSGTHELSLFLLSNNGIKPGGTTKLLYLDSDNAANELLKGTADAVFMMGDSVSRDKIRLLLTTPGVRLFDFMQASAYTRHIKYLHKLELPMGAIDYGKNIPQHDISLIGPTIELVARKNLHPALSDLLLEAATEVHSGAGMLKKRGEFPALFEEDFSVSPDAKRYYKSGQSWLYRELPFGIASMINRVIVLLLPLIVIFPSVIRGVPAIYRWRIRTRVYRCYRDLLDIEWKLMNAQPEQRAALLEELNLIEARVKENVPMSFADQFYALRGHIHFVRERANAF